MKHQARQVLIKTAEKNGIAWRQRVQNWEASGAKALLTQITDPNLAYPDYYQVPFHAYDAGNLCWQAAFEAESATYAMALRVWPQEQDLTWEAAQARLRGTFHQVLADHGPESVETILDMGCSVGISTRYLHHYYQQRQAKPVHTLGLDLSPYMLSVAQYHQARISPPDQAAPVAKMVAAETPDPAPGTLSWRHGNAEATDLEAASFDLITIQFLLHELPHQATHNIFQEAFRLLKPQGYLAIVDNNPRSPVIQNLPPALFTLMKSTEPWSDQYYVFDVEAGLEGSGFNHRVTVASDPRHRTIVAQKP
jgi:SAM-dependent methyltransferase